MAVLSESIIITIVAMAIALVFIELFFPTFNNLVYRELSFGLIGSVGLFSYVLLLTLIVGTMNTPELRSMEDHINFQYRSEKMLNNFLIYSVVLCILISCLGSFGLSSFIAENRRKYA